IEISRPNVDSGLYFNRKGYYFVNYLCAVDFNYRFRYVTFGFGSAHDSRIFRNSTLADYCSNLSHSNVHIVADAAFRSLDGVKTPNDDENINNIELEKQRVIIENSFGIFKSKFKKFNGLVINGEKSNYIKMFIATCLIHN